MNVWDITPQYKFKIRLIFAIAAFTILLR